MPRPRAISSAGAGVLVSVRFSREIIKLLDLIAERDGLSGRSALLREAAHHEIAARMEGDDGA